MEQRNLHIINNFIEDDLNWIKEIFNEENLNSKLSNLNEGHIQVIRPYAFIHYKKLYSGIHICEVSVHPLYRHKGLASKLINNLNPPIIVAALIDNKEANSLYRKLRFEDFGDNIIDGKHFRTWYLSARK